MTKLGPKPKKKKNKETRDAFEALGSPAPLPYNKVIEAAELAQADQEKYGPIIGSRREREGTATESLERGLFRLLLRLPNDPKKL